MKRGRFFLPLDQKEQSRLYWELSKRGAFASGEKRPWDYEGLSEEELLALAVFQSRYDPRLLAVLVDYFLTQNPSLHPVRFKDALREHRGLAAAAVLGEFVLEQAGEDPGSSAELFRYLMTGITPEPLQLFYRGLYPIAGSMMREVLERPLWYFKKWGFLALETPKLKDRPQKRRSYLYDEEGRLRILRNLIKMKGNIRLRDYLKAIDGSVSRQQALKDIRNLSGLRRVGRNRGAKYHLVS